MGLLETYSVSQWQTPIVWETVVVALTVIIYVLTLRKQSIEHTRWWICVSCKPTGSLDVPEIWSFFLLSKKLLLKIITIVCFVYDYHSVTHTLLPSWVSRILCIRKQRTHNRLDAAFILYRTQSWNGPLQSLNIDADAAVGIAYHISAFVKILQTQTNQPSVAWLSISMVYTLQGETWW